MAGLALLTLGLALVGDRTESIKKKIRNAELQKIPYMLVVGKREAESGEVALRRHREGDLGSMAINEVVERLTTATLERE